MIAAALVPLAARVERAHPGRFGPAVAAYAARHGLDPASPPVTLPRDRGSCHATVLWRRAEPDGTWHEHQLLVIPEVGGTVAEKRHFRRLANPADPEDPWLVIGDELVTGLCGALAVVGADVARPIMVAAGETARVYGCAIDPATRTIRWFQDRHALRAEAPWTAVVFQHRYTTLRRLEAALGPDHPALAEVRARELAVPG